MCFFFTLNIVLKKESQPKKIVCKIMNFGSTNWLNKKTKTKNKKQKKKGKSWEHNKCHDIFSIPLF